MGREVVMTDFIKDFLAVVSLGGFTLASLTWLDVLTRLG